MGLPSISIGPKIRRREAEKPLNNRGPSRSHEADESEHLTGSEREVNVVIFAIAAKTTDRKEGNRARVRRSPSIMPRSDLSPGHGMCNLNFGQILHWRIKRLRSISKNDDPVTNLGDLLKLVADENEALAACCQGAE